LALALLGPFPGNLRTIEAYKKSSSPKKDVGNDKVTDRCYSRGVEAITEKR
jgi:hypothetical protein